MNRGVIREASLKSRDEGVLLYIHSIVMMTGDELSGGSKPVSEVGENETKPLEDPISSLLGSFQSLHSSQSSKSENETFCSSFRRN